MNKALPKRDRNGRFVKTNRTRKEELFSLILGLFVVLWILIGMFLAGRWYQGNLC